MSQEITKDLTVDEKLDLVLAKLRGMNNRLTALETTVNRMDARLTVVESELSLLAKKVDDRLHDTRPMWQAIHAQTEKLTEKVEDLSGNVEGVNETLKHFRYQLEDIAVVHQDLKAGQREHRKRLEALEAKAA